MPFIPDTKQDVKPTPGFVPSNEKPTPGFVLGGEIPTGEISRPTGFLERLKLSFGTKEEQAQRVEPKGFLAGGLKEIPRDIADVAGGALRLGGLIGGGIAGTAAGLAGGPGGAFAGGIAGAGAGSGAGEFIRQRIGENFGLQQNATTRQQLAEIGKEAFIGSIAQALGGPLSKVTGLLLRMAAKPFVPIKSFIGEFGRSIFKATTGVAEQAQITAITRPGATRAGFKKSVTATNIDAEVKEAHKQVSKIAKDAFQEGLQSIQDTPIPKLLPSAFKGVTEKFIKIAQESRIGFNKKGNITSFPVKIETAAQNNVKTSYNLIKNWKDFSVEGLQNLMEDLQSLKNFEKAVSVGGLKVSGETPVVSTLINNVRGLIKTHYPELNKIRGEFGVYAKLLRGVDDLFKAVKEGPVAIKTGVAKLTNIFKEDNDIYISYLLALEKASGKTFLGRLAGTEFQRMSPDVLRSSLAVGGFATLISGTGNPAAFLILPLFSPRVIGGVLTRGAQVSGGVKAGVKAVKPFVEPSAKAGLQLLLGRDKQ